MVEFVSQINAKADEVYSWHQNIGASERLSPPWSSAELLRQEENLDETLKFMKTNSGTLLEKTKSIPNTKSIISERIRSSQQKTHYVKSFNNINNRTLIKETISVNLFSSILPKFMIESIVENKLINEFNFRKQRIEKDIQQHRKFASMPRKNIAMLGADKSLAKQFTPFFTSGKNKVFSFVKRKPYPNTKEIQLNTSNNHVGLSRLKNIDSVLFFALGEKTKLTEQNINTHLESKIKELRLLIRSFAVNKSYPESFIMISSTCVYKAFNASITEHSPVSHESAIANYFLTLEKEISILKKHGVRVTYARTGNILSTKTGLLKNLYKKQKFAFCNQELDSRKTYNWTSLDDAIYATNQIIFDTSLDDAVNICSAMSLNSNDLAKLLTTKTKRPFLFTLPKFIFNLFCGKIMKDKFLQSNSVFPQKLKKAGFNFSFENIDTALNWETGNLTTSNLSDYY